MLCLVHKNLHSIAAKSNYEHCSRFIYCQVNFVTDSENGYLRMEKSNLLIYLDNELVF